MDLIRKLQDDQGWTDATLLDLLITYIANQQSHAALADFLQEHCAEEQDCETLEEANAVVLEALHAETDKEMLQDLLPESGAKSLAGSFDCVRLSYLVDVNAHTYDNLHHVLHAFEGYRSRILDTHDHQPYSPGSARDLSWKMGRRIAEQDLENHRTIP